MKSAYTFLLPMLLGITLLTSCAKYVNHYRNPMNGRVQTAQKEADKAEDLAAIQEMNEMGSDETSEIPEMEYASKEETHIMHFENSASPVTNMMQAFTRQGQLTYGQVSELTERVELPQWVRKPLQRKMRLDKVDSTQKIDAELRLIILLAGIALILAILASIFAGITGKLGLWWILHLAAGIIFVVALILGLIYLLEKI